MRLKSGGGRDRPDNQGNQSAKEKALMLPLRLGVDTSVLISAALTPEASALPLF
jgi:hypothetical protein